MRDKVSGKRLGYFFSIFTHHIKIFSKAIHHSATNAKNMIDTKSKNQVIRPTSINIGIIGMGAMGRLCAKRFFDSSWTSINVCDVQENYDKLKSEFPQYNVYVDGHPVCQKSDFVLFCTPSLFIADLIREYAPSLKPNAIVGGQTSTKALEISAFEHYCPSTTNIVTCHSFHGPDMNPFIYPLAILRHRATDKAFNVACQILQSLNPNPIHLSPYEHDHITAHVQILLHTCLLARLSVCYLDYTSHSNLENHPFLIPCLRLMSQPWHVYGGMAMSHPFTELTFNKFLSLFESDILKQPPKNLEVPSFNFYSPSTDSCSSSFTPPLDLPLPLYVLILLGDQKNQKLFFTPLYLYVHFLVHQSIQFSHFPHNVSLDPRFLDSFRTWMKCILSKNSQHYQFMYERMQSHLQPLLPAAKKIWSEKMKWIESKVPKNGFHHSEE